MHGASLAGASIDSRYQLWLGGLWEKDKTSQLVLWRVPKLPRTCNFWWSKFQLISFNALCCAL